MILKVHLYTYLKEVNHKTGFISFLDQTISDPCRGYSEIELCQSLPVLIKLPLPMLLMYIIIFAKFTILVLLPSFIDYPIYYFLISLWVYPISILVCFSTCSLSLYRAPHVHTFINPRAIFFPNLNKVKLGHGA